MLSSEASRSLRYVRQKLLRHARCFATLSMTYRISLTISPLHPLTYQASF